jgi:hypothetical protein
MFILKIDLMIVTHQSCQGRQSKGRKKRIFDRPKQRTLSLGQGRKDHFNFHDATMNTVREDSVKRIRRIHAKKSRKEKPLPALF